MEFDENHSGDIGKIAVCMPLPFVSISEFEVKVPFDINQGFKMAAIALAVVKQGLQLFCRLDESRDDVIKMVQALKSLRNPERPSQSVILDSAVSLHVFSSF
jgi:hypothetical protein